jgi:hypothetical protein
MEAQGIVHRRRGGSPVLVATGLLGAVVWGVLATAAWAGTTWTIRPTPNPAGTSGSVTNRLEGVSCPSPTACTAVGYDEGATSSDTAALVEVWNGQTWQGRQPVARSNANLLGVSCPSPTACTAVGYFDNAQGALVALAEEWNGSTWTTSTVPVPAGGSGAVLTAVSCSSAAACTAVGRYYAGPDLRPMAVGWNGSAWHIEHVPVPVDTSQGALSAVSCPLVTACLAVGSIGESVLTERWNGTAWTRGHSPWAGVAVSVSCPSSTDCAAVGTGPGTAGGDVPLALGWDGTTWTVEHAPNPGGSSSVWLFGVSCVSPTACTAVGAQPNAGTAPTFAEGWNGTRWQREDTPDPAGVPSPYLLAVSCGSPTICVAVGSDGIAGSGERTLAESSS